ncbi:MAG: hypothetical protein KGI33_11330 [Thaumarchaeota archaeon]|nr:hypothetical protein [Nitrososphaerota archaeon]
MVKIEQFACPKGFRPDVLHHPVVAIKKISGMSTRKVFAKIDLVRENSCLLPNGTQNDAHAVSSGIGSIK